MGSIMFSEEESSRLCLAMQKTIELESRAIYLAWDSVDKPALTRLYEILINCTGKVLLSGCGAAGIAAQKIAHTLSSVDQQAFFLEPAEALHGGLGVIRAGDILLLLSKGGASKEMLDMVAPAKRRRATVVVVTEAKASALADVADHVLHFSSGPEAGDEEILATSSVVAMLCLFDALCIQIARHNGFSLNEFGYIHPGGAVGAKLNSKEPTL